MKSLIQALKRLFCKTDVSGSFLLKFKKKYHRFWKMVYFKYHPHSYYSDGFVKHYNKLKQLEPDKWS